VGDLVDTGLTRFSFRTTLDPLTASQDPEASIDTDPHSTIYHLRLPGRVLIKGLEEETCLLRWVCGLVARIVVERAGASLSGSRAILYLDLIGRVEGTIAWASSAEIDVAIEAPSAKRLRLQQQFEKLAAMAPDERENVRGHRRITLTAPDVALWLMDGMTTMARVRDISRSGAAVIATILPETGTIVVLGSTRGRVVRQFADGFAIQFLRLLPLELFGPSFAL
jgi:hypothetical protein